MDVDLMIDGKMSQPIVTVKRQSRLFPGIGPRPRKGSGDGVVQQGGRRLRYSGIGKAAYWYDALRLSLLISAES